MLEGDGRGASIKDLVAQALESFGQRVTITGPHVHLTASIAQGFALKQSSSRPHSGAKVPA